MGERPPDPNRKRRPGQEAAHLEKHNGTVAVYGRSSDGRQADFDRGADWAAGIIRRQLWQLETERTCRGPRLIANCQPSIQAVAEGRDRELADGFSAIIAVIRAAHPDYQVNKAARDAIGTWLDGLNDGGAVP
jgi:hypothetical protein